MAAPTSPKPRAVSRARVRDATLGAPVLLGLVALAYAAPPTGTLSSPTARHCPSDMTLVGLAGDVCVDRYEASLVEVRADGSEVPWSPYHSPHAHAVRAVSRAGVVPQAYVSMADARRACKASNKRLCKPAEWISACKGPLQTAYPYGANHVPGACTDAGRTAPLPKLHSGKAMFENKNMIDPRLNQLANTVARTGEASSCTNAAGAFDMVGNLHEWTDDGTLHGGFYLDVTTLGAGCDYVTKAHAPVYYDYSTGFRCCADPTLEPPQEAKATPPPGKKVAKR